MKDSGKMICKKDMVRNIGLINHHTMVSIGRVKKMEKVFTFGLMVAITTEIGLKIKSKGMGAMFGLMAESMLVSG